MKQYKELLIDILENGEVRPDRTGVGTKSVFGRQIRFNLQDGFPAVTTKKLAFNAVKAELLWFLSGSTNERDLCELTHGTRDASKATIWTENALSQGVSLGYKNGELGPVYGKQWRNFGGVDQVTNLITGIKNDPHSRRHIINAWNCAELDKMSLVPCHVMSQYYVSVSGKLSCHMYQRSCDVGLGFCFNAASYALLTHMLAQICNLRVGELIISIGDTHIYTDHIEPLKEQITREPYPLPALWLNPAVKNIFDFKMDDIKLENYRHHPTISMKMAV